MSRYVTCKPAGVHLGSKRFRNLVDRPIVKDWRCDLTALSRLYNLYFVACNDTIHVHQPDFPDQSLSSEPALILHPPVAATTGPGIDPQDPHSITRIFVDYLGDEEILLVACDDGSVIGYRTDSIQKAFDIQDSSPGLPLEHVDEKHVKIFLLLSVGASAWGLAVHREARMIAVSANTYEVTIIAFGLASPADISSDLIEIVGSDTCDCFVCRPPEGTQDPRFTQEDRLPLRQRDHRITLKTTTNMPSVSFNNNGEDPYGRWLFSNSIDGKTMVWDIYYPRAPARVIQLGWCASVVDSRRAPDLLNRRCACLNTGHVPHATWGAMILDTRSAYEISLFDERGLELVESPPCFKEITASLTSFTVKSYGDLHTLGPVNTLDMTSDDGDHDSDVDSMQLFDEETDLSPSSSEASNMEDVSDAESSSDSISTNNREENNEIGEADTGGQPVFYSEPDNSMAPTAAQIQLLLGATTQLHSIQASPQSYNVVLNAPSQVSNDFDAPDYDSEIYSDYIGESSSDDTNIDFEPRRRAMADTKSYCEVTGNTMNLDDDMLPSTPCLILTKEALFLVQQPFSTSEDDFGPVISMCKPLHPGPWVPFLASIDRLSLLTQIPELGIFVVATQVGRAGVFSLYYTKEKDTGKRTYGYKLEYLLPYERGDEKAVCVLQEPGARLIGVAVGPLQGMFDPPADLDRVGLEETIPQPRRWRLMMYFTDHTVLSFELSKPRREGSPGLEELVV